VAFPWAQAPPPRKVVVVDFEFRADPGERPFIWCMAFHEIHTGRRGVSWRDELAAMSAPPFDVGPNVAIVGYFATAEWSCFKQLGWPMPAQPIDLFAEGRVAFNRFIPHDLRRPGAPGGDRWGLYDMLARYGLEAGDTHHKTAMRKMAMTASLSSWTVETLRALLDYCLDDVLKTSQLFDRMFTTIDWPQARLRGLYTAVVAAIEHAGIPLDGKLYRELLGSWGAIKTHYITELEETYKYSFHVDGSFKDELFVRWLSAHGMEWPATKAGTPRVNNDTFKMMEKAYPKNGEFPGIGPLRRFHSHIEQLRLIDLAVGADDRNRCLSSVFHGATGRTIYSTSKHIWQIPAQMRSLVWAESGQCIVILDVKAQEYAITAVESGEERMIEAYLTGDPYMAFAHDSGLAERHVTAKDDPALRAQCKIVALGIPYGMTGHGAAAQLGVSEMRGHELVQRHQMAYPRCHEWLREVYNKALVNEIMISKFGWKWRPVPYCTVTRYDPPSRRSILNFTCQANGADEIRAAAVLGWMAGIEIISTMHDAVMFLTTRERLDEDTDTMTACLVQAGYAVTGIKLDIEAKTVIGPAHYRDEKRGATDWDRTLRILHEVRSEGR
jgi:DNA polymerase-1